MFNQKETSKDRAEPKAIIFDMDGTLVSSLPAIYHCENEISLKYLKTSLTLDDVISKFGPPAHTIIRDMTRLSLRAFKAEQCQTTTNVIELMAPFGDSNFPVLPNCYTRSKSPDSAWLSSQVLRRR